MRHVTVRVDASHVTPTKAYELIGDFARYPELTDAVKEVRIDPAAETGGLISTWTVAFRNGLLSWTERDVWDTDARTISFTQLSGDFLSFEGVWRIAESGEPDGSRVTFDAAFDLGIPSLAELLDPVAEAALRDNIVRILGSLLGELRVVDDVPLADAVASGG